MKMLGETLLVISMVAVLLLGIQDFAEANGEDDGGRGNAVQTTDQADTSVQRVRMPADRMHEMMEDLSMGKVDDKGNASGATMDIVYSTDELYTCSMHKQVVSDNPGGKCPLCGMKMVKMSDEDVETLRASHPQGCVMDPIVKPEAEGEQHCDICGMTLKPIFKPDTGNDK